MNKLFKVLVLAIYSITLLFITIVVMNGTSKAKRFEDYSDTPYNDDITLNVQVLENRQTAAEREKDYEYSKFDIYLFITKRQDSVISNMYSYIAVQNKDKKFGYSETNSSKSMSKGVTQNTTMSFLNSSTAFSYHEITVEKDNNKDKIKNIDYSPKKIMVKVAYDIEYDSNPGIVESKEFNYSFEYKEENTKKFGDYTNRTINNYIEGPDDVFKLKITKTLDSEQKTTYKCSYFGQIADKLEAKIKTVNFSVYGKATNEKCVSKYFGDYIRIFTYHGALNNYAINTTRSNKLSDDFGIEKLFVTASFELENGKVIVNSYYLNVNDLATS